MKLDIPKYELLGYLVELVNEYARHGVDHVESVVDEISPGTWRFQFTFKFTEE